MRRAKSTPSLVRKYGHHCTLHMHLLELLIRVKLVSLEYSVSFIFYQILIREKIVPVSLSYCVLCIYTIYPFSLYSVELAGANTQEMPSH